MTGLVRKLLISSNQLKGYLLSYLLTLLLTNLLLRHPIYLNSNPIIAVPLTQYSYAERQMPLQTAVMTR